MIKNAPAAVISRQTLLLLYRRFILLCWFDVLQRIAACVLAHLLPHRRIARARRMVASPNELSPLITPRAQRFVWVSSGSLTSLFSLFCPVEYHAGLAGKTLLTGPATLKVWLCIP
jgi:hypothetical protein